MSYGVTPDDIEARWRALSPAETAVAEVLLGDAEVLLDAELPTLAAAVVAETVPALLVTQTLVQMVKRVLVNPDLDRSASIADLSSSSLSSGELYVSVEEKAALSAAILGPSSGALRGATGSVRLVPSWGVWTYPE